MGDAVPGGGARKTGRGWSDLQGELREVRDLAQWLRDLIDRCGATVRTLDEQLPIGRDKISKSVSGAYRPEWAIVEGIVKCCTPDTRLLERRLNEARARWTKADPATATRIPAAPLVGAARRLADPGAEIGVYQQLVKALEQQSALERQLGESHTLVLTLRLMVSQLEKQVEDLTRERDALLQRRDEPAGVGQAERLLATAKRQHERAEAALQRARDERDEAERLRILAEERARRWQAELEELEREQRLGEAVSLVLPEPDQPMLRRALERADDVDRALDKADLVLTTQAGELARIADELEATAPTLAGQLRVVVGRVVDPRAPSAADNHVASADTADNQVPGFPDVAAFGASGASAQAVVRPRPGSQTHAAARLRALTAFAKSMAATQSVEDVIRISVREAQRDLRAAAASISMWERSTGQLRVLANHGKLAPGEVAFPKDESYPVSDFPKLLMGEDDLGPWIQVADDDYGDPKRVAMLRRRNRYSAVIAPIVFNGRAWGELLAARTIDQPIYDREDVDFAAALTAQIAGGLAQADRARQFERLAHTDQLTGLANRRSFDARLAAAIDHHADDGAVVSLVLCYANGVERVTEEYGPARGDALLVQLAGVVSAAAALLPGSLASRLSDHEFCVLIEGFGADDTVRVAEELCTLALTVRGGEGVACGVASTGDRIGDIIAGDRLLHLADDAQRRARRSRSLHPVIAGRGQPPNMTGPTASPGLAVESLLAQAFAALDEARRQNGPGATATTRITAALQVIARGLDAASWYLYCKPAPDAPCGLVHYAISRIPADIEDGLLARLPQPVGPGYFLDSDGAPLGGGGHLALRARTDAQTHTDLAELAAAGYTGALTSGASAPDGSQWAAVLLLDPISRQSASAFLLLRAVLGAAVG